MFRTISPSIANRPQRARHRSDIRSSICIKCSEAVNNKIQLSSNLGLLRQLRLVVKIRRTSPRRSEAFSGFAAHSWGSTTSLRVIRVVRVVRPIQRRVSRRTPAKLNIVEFVFLIRGTTGDKFYNPQLRDRPRTRRREARRFMAKKWLPCSGNCLDGNYDMQRQ